MRQRAIEAYDTLEAPPPRKGCNAKLDNGRRCSKLVVSWLPGPFGIRRLCAEHARRYRAHDAVLARIRNG